MKVVGIKIAAGSCLREIVSNKRAQANALYSSVSNKFRLFPRASLSGAKANHMHNFTPLPTYITQKTSWLLKARFNSAPALLPGL